MFFVFVYSSRFVSYSQINLEYSLILYYKISHIGGKIVIFNSLSSHPGGKIAVCTFLSSKNFGSKIAICNLLSSHLGDWTEITIYVKKFISWR